MGNFDHYHDMDHDGDRDLKDSGMFHDMEGHHNVGHAGEDEFYILFKTVLIIGGIILALVLLFT